MGKRLNRHFIGRHNLSVERTGIHMTLEEAEQTVAMADGLRVANWHLLKAVDGLLAEDTPETRAAAQKAADAARRA